MMGAEPSIMAILGKADFVGLVETGAGGPEGPGLPGFTCIHVMPRENGNRLHTHTGGVGLFVRTAISPRVSLVRTHQAFGILWARVAPPPAMATTRPTYIGVCYMPHGGSKIYKNGAGDMEAQWALLQSDLAEFSTAGQIVLMGDFNAHTGTATDGAAEGLPPRASSDTHAVDDMGQRLLDMCSMFGLLILNGRLPGDETGCITHKSAARQRPTGQETRGTTGTHASTHNGTLLDYIIASPDLAFQTGGAPLPRAWLRVVGSGDMTNLPRKPETNKHYDHAPVLAQLRTIPPGTGNAPPPATPAHTDPVRLVWRPALQNPWVETLQGSAIPRWEGLDTNMQTPDALRLWTQGFDSAVQTLHQQQKRVIVRGGSTPAHRPVNGWYDDACADARRAFKAAGQEHGDHSSEAKAAHKTYKKTCATARAAFQKKRREEMVQNLYSNPRAFWKAFKAEARTNPPITLTEWTQYFRNMFQANMKGDYVGGSIDTHCSQHPDLFPSPTPQASTTATLLNVPFTDAELQTALAKLSDNKAAGVDGMPAEFLTHACTTTQGADGKTTRHYILGPTLAKLFTCILLGTYPATWGTSALAPVPKAGGRADDPNDYRGIAVSAVLSKLYSLCLFARLDPWAESSGLRAKGQAGFRQGRSTVDNCFILRHLSESAAAKGKPLYAAFIDFSKAYDRIDRALLWKVLEGAGLHGPALATLQQMYACVSLRVRCKGELGEAFEAGVGVKQGCPLSPLLFGIYLDRLEGYLETRCPGDGVSLGPGALVRALFYADDIALVSDTAAGLQRMLDALHTFCGANSMFVNRTKSEVVIFGQQATQPGPGGMPFLCGPATLETRPSYKYLGLVFESENRLAGSLQRAIGKAQKSAKGVQGKCYKLKLHNPDLQGRLFDSLVQPVLSYGCEVWGPDHSAEPSKPSKQLAATAGDKEVRLPFLRQSLGVGKQTCTAPLLAELGRQPLAVYWITMAAKLWNRALTRQPTDYLRLALVQNLSESGQRGGPERKGMWASQFTACLGNLGVEWGSRSQPRQIDLHALARAAETLGVTQAERQLDTAARGKPVRQVPDDISRGFVGHTYAQWFKPAKWTRRTSFAYSLSDHTAVQAVAKFRLSMHGLAVQAARLQPGARLPRSQRTCPCCNAGREDEMHMLIECPAYDGLRAEFPDMFAAPQGGWSDKTLNMRFNQESREGWEGLARFLMGCFEIRNTMTGTTDFAGAPRGRTRREGN